MKRRKVSYKFTYPERGTVALLLGIVFSYVLVEHAIHGLSQLLGPDYPSLFPEPARTLALGLLAWAAIMALSLEGYRQYEANPRTFTTIGEIRTFHVAKRFDREQYMTNISISILGAVMVLYGWPEFIGFFENTVQQFVIIYIQGRHGEIPPLHFIWETIYVAGFTAFALSLDRVVVAFVRDLRIKLLQRQLIKRQFAKS